MEIYTWHTTALAPTFGMPASGPASCAAHALVGGAAATTGTATTAVVDVDAVRIKRAFPGFPAWSPPIS